MKESWYECADLLAQGWRSAATPGACSYPSGSISTTGEVVLSVGMWPLRLDPKKGWRPDAAYLEQQ